MLTRVTFLLLATLGCAAGPLRSEEVAPHSTQLEITGLSPSYSVDAPIEFTLTKRTTGDVTFACAAEIYVDGEWHETRWDIFSNAYKALSFARSHIIKTASLQLKWDIPHQKQPLHPEPGHNYRLRVDILAPREESFYSPAFSIVK